MICKIHQEDLLCMSLQTGRTPGIEGLFLKGPLSKLPLLRRIWDCGATVREKVNNLCSPFFFSILKKEWDWASISVMLSKRDLTWGPLVVVPNRSSWTTFLNLREPNNPRLHVDVTKPYSSHTWVSRSVIDLVMSLVTLRINWWHNWFEVCQNFKSIVPPLI